ncbi:MAG: TIGR04211 family SH3 domain-containing protein [Porticoccaceae bacterium]|nr:TIGR04211 family SH3 domain-containing protein [Porticoccaceae bacterium]
MLRFLFATTLVALPVLAAAQTQYITDEPRVPLRDSPCATCATVHPGLVAGTPLTVVDSKDDWTQVTLEEGTTGWLPSLYLSSEQVATANLDADSLSLHDENIRLKNQLAELASAHEELQVELSIVRKLSTNALTLQEQNEELIKRNRILQSDIDVLTASRDQLEGDNRQRWFLYGGLTLFLGALLAVLLPSLKPRRRYSEWG